MTVTFKERLDNGSDHGGRNVEVVGHCWWGVTMLDNQIDNPFMGMIIDFVVLPVPNSWHGVASKGRASCSGANVRKRGVVERKGYNGRGKRMWMIRYLNLMRQWQKVSNWTLHTAQRENSNLCKIMSSGVFLKGQLHKIGNNWRFTSRFAQN